MIEILVSLVIAGIVMSGLMFLIVEMLKLSRREEVLNVVQTDMQRALGYINQDVREAVYVYDDPNYITNQIPSLKTKVDSGDYVATLAFWRADPFDVGKLNSDCTSYSDDTQDNACDVLKIRQTTYTLVVYLQVKENGNASVWQPGLSRIVRYELPKYRSGADLSAKLNKDVITEGYRDPFSQESEGFETWKPNLKDYASVKVNGAVLVDQVDRPDRLTKAEAEAQLPQCPTGFIQTPGFDISTSFYVCVRGAAANAGQGSSNQDLVLFLRGSGDDQSAGLFGGLNQASVLPTLRSQVLVRGVQDKQI